MPELQQGQPLRLEGAAASADPGLPAFLARPRGAPVYHGFPLIEETRTDGWVYGAITEVPDPEDGTGGDAYVVAPDGARAGLAWSVGSHATQRILGPERGRWGVFEIAFPRPVRTLPDLVFCFRHVLPELQALYAAYRARRRRTVAWICTVLALVLATAVALALGACGGGSSPEVEPPRSEAVVEAFEGWMGAHQSPSGAWEAEGFARWRSGVQVDDVLEGVGRREHDVLVTALAVAPFIGAGYSGTHAGPKGSATYWGLRSLESSQRPDGGFGDWGVSGWAVRDAVATWAAVRAAQGGDRQAVSPWAQRALDHVVGSFARGDAGWTEEGGPARLPAVGWLALALRATEPRKGEEAAVTVPDEVRRRVYEEVARWSDSSPDLGRNAAAILARVGLGEDPKESEAVAAAAVRCIERAPRWEPASGTMDFAAWYLGTEALLPVGGESWRRWNEAMKTAIVDTQRRDTTYCRYRGSWDPLDRWGAEGGRVYATAFQSLSLSVYYRYDRVMSDPGDGSVPKGLPPPPIDHSGGRLFARCD